MDKASGAIDQRGQVIDVLGCEKRDLPTIRRFFACAVKHGRYPTEVTTDRALAYLRVLDELLFHVLLVRGEARFRSRQSSDQH